MSNGLKLALGWVLTVFVALAFSWGAIAQVRNRVEQPATVIPTSILTEAAAEETATSPTTTLEVIGLTPEAVEIEASTTTTTDVITTKAAVTTTTQPSSSGSTSTTSTDEPNSSDSSSVTTATAAPTSSGSSPTTSSTTTTLASSATTSTSTSTTSTSTTSTSTTSTTVAPVTQTSTYSLTGGIVTISYSPGVVNLVGASPKNGYGTEVKKSGPNEVKVIFKSDDHESEFTAKWEGGKLEIEQEESDDDGDD